MDSERRERFRRVAEEALNRDFDSVVRGRTLWRVNANTAEILAKCSSLFSIVFAFVASSELTNDHYTRVFSFTAGVCGTSSMALAQFAVWAQKQALERTAGMMAILQENGVESIPDIFSLQSSNPNED